MTKEHEIVPVILCGGAGTRLWPESRESRPKHFLKLKGDNSLLEQTIRRASTIADVDFKDILIVTLSDLESDIRVELDGFCKANNKPEILGEPSARDTAAAVALAVSHVLNTYGEKALLWVLPADHYIGEPESLKRALKQACVSADNDALVTFGINPTRPETGYGYIRLGDALEQRNSFKADSFVEKPNLVAAQQYLKQGGYVWNSGMFLFKAGTAQSEFAKHAPDIMNAVQFALQSDRLVDADTYTKIPKKPFDKAVMEKSDSIHVVCCDPEWSDIGSWESIWEISDKDENENVLTGSVITQNVTGSVIKSHKKVIACTDVKDIVVIETEDAILIANRKDGNSVKQLVSKLKNDGFSEF